MIIKEELNSALEELEVVIRHNQEDEMVKRIRGALEALDAHLIVQDEKGKKRVHIADIYYLESVDKKTFVYCQDSVYTTDLRLYQVLEELEGKGFIQISKSMILNIHMLESVTSLLNRRLEITLKNGEKIIATRKYIESIKHALEGDQYA